MAYVDWCASSLLGEEANVTDDPRLVDELSDSSTLRIGWLKDVP